MPGWESAVSIFGPIGSSGSSGWGQDLLSFFGEPLRFADVFHPHCIFFAGSFPILRRDQPFGLIFSADFRSGKFSSDPIHPFRFFRSETFMRPIRPFRLLHPERSGAEIRIRRLTPLPRRKRQSLRRLLSSGRKVHKHTVLLCPGRQRHGHSFSLPTRNAHPSIARRSNGPALPENGS